MDDGDKGDSGLKRLEKIIILGTLSSVATALFTIGSLIYFARKWLG